MFEIIKLLLGFEIQGPQIKKERNYWKIVLKWKTR